MSDEFQSDIIHMPKENPEEIEKAYQKQIKHSYNKGGLTVLVAFAVVNAVALVIAFLLQVTMMLRGASIEEVMTAFSGVTFYTLLVNVIALSIAYFVAFVVGKKLMGVGVKSFLTFDGISPTFLLRMTVIAISLQFILSLVANFIVILLQKAGINATTLDTTTSPDLKTNILMYVVGLIIAPICEEILFRGFLQRAMSTVSVKFGIIISAVLFGLYHGNISQGIVAIGLGLLLGYVSYKFQSIVPCIIIHFIMNLNGLGLNLMSYISENFAIIFNYCWSSGMVIAATVLVLCFRKDFTLPNETPDERSRTFPILVKSWSVVALTVVLLVVTTLSVKISG